MTPNRRIGVLALQGGVREHVAALNALDVLPVEVRTPLALDDVEALVLPGGESTTISKLLESSGLFDAIAKRIENGTLGVFGTCAGMILSATQIIDGRSDQRSFGVFPAVVRRNGIGRQVVSSEEDIAVKGFDKPIRAVFIRAPVVESVEDGVEVFAENDHGPVLCAYGRHLFATFHPELTNDRRIHRLFLERL